MGSKKKKYVKPQSVDLGKVSPVMGDGCSYGDAADFVCTRGQANIIGCSIGDTASGPFGCDSGSAPT